MRYAFAGDRQISCNILKFLIDKGYKPKALLVTDGLSSTHADELIKISGLSQRFIFKGKSIIKDPKVLKFLNDLELDYIIGIHYPYIIPNELINLPKIGFLNLHPAYLPYNKGWNTPSWAIIDKSTYGATLHFMSEKLDEGDIIHQEKLEVFPYDTANSLYSRVLSLEEKVFYDAVEDLIELKPRRKKQINRGTSYKKSDLQKVQEFDLDQNVIVRDFLDKLRALSTNNNNELAYFRIGSKKVGVKVEFLILEEYIETSST